MVWGGVVWCGVVCCLRYDTDRCMSNHIRDIVVLCFIVRSLDWIERTRQTGMELVGAVEGVVFRCL